MPQITAHAAYFVMASCVHVQHFSKYKKAQGQPGRVVQISGWSGAHGSTLWQCTELTCRRWTQHVVVHNMLW